MSVFVFLLNVSHLYENKCNEDKKIKGDAQAMQKEDRKNKYNDCFQTISTKRECQTDFRQFLFWIRKTKIVRQPQPYYCQPKS
jgi:hypothetical protein